jgi:hypothetical protein
LNADFVASANKLFDQAEAACNGNDNFRSRIQVARLPIWYVQLMNNWLIGEARQNRLNEFLAIARKAGISNVSESKTLDDWAKRMKP